MIAVHSFDLTVTSVIRNVNPIKSISASSFDFADFAGFLTDNAIKLVTGMFVQYTLPKVKNDQVSIDSG